MENAEHRTKPLTGGNVVSHGTFGNVWRQGGLSTAQVRENETGI